MATFTALTTLAGRDAAERLGEAMERLSPAPIGVGVFEVEDDSGLWEVGGYFEAPPDEAALALLTAAFDARPFAVSQLPDVDWVAHVRRELQPVTAGRFFLYGSHDAARVPPDAVSLLIDAAMAFGTGHHGTTAGCLTAFDKLISSGFAARNIADIGCGTAVLAMAAAKVWAQDVIASDIDPVAVEVALANIAANGLDGRVRCVQAAGFDHPELARTRPFDLVFANILKAPLLALAPDMSAAVETGGRAILSGLLNEQADEVIAAYGQQGFACDDRLIMGEWSTLTLRRN